MGYSQWQTFIVRAQVVVSAVTPMQVDPNGGTQLTIDGSGLPDSMAASQAGSLKVLARSAVYTVNTATSTRLA